MSALLAAMAAALATEEGGPGPGGDWTDAINAIAPQIWLRMADTGTQAANDGSGVDDGTVHGSAHFQAGALVDDSGSDSIGFTAAGQWIEVPNNGTNGSSWTGIVGLIYRGRGGGNTSARILFRDYDASALYINLSSTNVSLNISGSSIDTGVPSASVRDGEPHLFLLAILTAGTPSFYIDGELVWTSAGYSMTVANTPWHIVRNSSYAEYTYGRYSDFVVAKGTYTQDQVDAINAAWSPVAAATPVELTGISWSQSSTYGSMESATVTNMRDSNVSDPSTGTGTNPGSPAYVQAALGATYDIEQVTLGAGNISMGGWGAVASFLNGGTVQVSVDNVDWTDVFAIEGLSDSSPREVSFDVPSVPAAYVRIARSGYLAVATFRIYRKP